MLSTRSDLLLEQLALTEVLLAGRSKMLNPQDLPDRYGRVINAIDRILDAIDCEAVVGGGWAVWRYGFVNRVTNDIDIVLPADRIQEFLQVASVSGFQILHSTPGRWPKAHHKESDVQLDILPEGERPGVPPDLAPTTIPSPSLIGGTGAALRYINLPALIELKIAAGRLKDQSDVVELIKVNRDQIDTIRNHLIQIHVNYGSTFENLLKRAGDEMIDR